VIPALVIVFLLLAFLERVGIVLLISLLAGLTSLAMSCVALWGAVETAGWPDLLWPA
jgi:hypothetical protein